MHEHGHAIEGKPAYPDSRIAQIGYVGIQPINAGTVQALVMVPANKQLMRIRQVTEPIHEVDGFRLAAVHRKVSGMYDQIGLGQVIQAAVHAVCV